MNTQLGKNFIVTLMAVVLGLGGLTWLSGRTHTRDAPQVAAAMTETSQQAPVAGVEVHPDAVAYPTPDSQVPRPAASTDSANQPASSYEDGYRSGYQDAERDCAQSRTSTRATARPAARYYSGRSTRRYYSSRSYARSGVAGVSYVSARKRDHSTRNMILTVAAPAALAAGIGGIAGGGKGAGIGALIGGGGGALYYLLKHRR